MTQQAKTFEQTFDGTHRLRYLLHLPADYEENPDKHYPLIFFLHGAGERGNDLAFVKRHGIAKVVETQPDFPFITVSPQCPAEMWWSDHIPALIGLLDEIVDTHRVDENHIYLTGLSMGSFGGWHLLTEQPDRFAAAILICGGRPWYLNLEERSRRIADVPLWVFHGDADDVVPIAASREVVDALKAAGSPVRYTIYRGVRHDSWTRTYDNPEIYDWLLEHSLDR